MGIPGRLAREGEKGGKWHFFVLNQDLIASFTGLI
jgi:hypothetical protein